MKAKGRKWKNEKKELGKMEKKVESWRHWKRSRYANRSGRNEK